MHGIEQDHNRFRQIIKGKIRDNLKKYISHGDIISRNRSGKISIPLPRIDLPKFVFSNKNGGVGQGDDNGQLPGEEENALEVDVSVEEMADLLGEQLELPRIEPKDSSDLIVDSKRYNSYRRVGPESLRSFKKTFAQALKRSITAGEYDPEDPFVVPIKDDKRYKSPKPILLPETKAVIFYLMDVSGSMGTTQKELARLTSFWIDLWLRRNYKNLSSRYIVHNTVAREVDQEAFYRIKEGGGTLIYTAYELCSKIISVEYNPADWNIYIFQYSDGDDWTEQHSSTACRIINQLLPSVNQVSYCQVGKGGEFMRRLKTYFRGEEKVVTTLADHREKIYDAIREFFVRGQ